MIVIDIAIAINIDTACNDVYFNNNTAIIIVRSWFVIVETVNAQGFICARNTWNNKALIATGMINTSMNKNIFGDILKYS